MLGMFKKKANAMMKRHNGDMDFLEAVCSAAALVAAADGTVSDEEVAGAVDAARNNDTLRSGFSQSQIEECMDKQLKRVKTISGKVQLQRELDDVAKKEIETRQDVFLAAADVASADGNISAEERDVLAKIAKRLDVNDKDLLDV